MPPRAWLSPARKPSQCGHARVFQMEHVESPGLEPFTLPVWLV